MASAASILFGGLFTVSLASSLTILALQSVIKEKRGRLQFHRQIAKEKASTIANIVKEFHDRVLSLYDPIAINPSLCVPCDGKRLLLGTILSILFGGRYTPESSLGDV